MTIGKVFADGFLGEKPRGFLEGMDAISMLCLYQMVQGEEEYERLDSLTISEENSGERMLQEMLSFRYFRKKNCTTTEQVLKHLNRKRIHYSIWRNRSWLRGKAPEAYVKRGFLRYPEQKDGKAVEKKVWLYSYKMLFAKPKSFVGSILDELKIVD